MKAIWGAPLLLLLGLLGYLDAAEEGCALWTSLSDTKVCCKECRQGNYMVDQCGPDPTKLCQLCTEGTYLSDHSWPTCRRCTKCEGAYKVKKPCTVSSDTVCDCEMGYRCGNPRCSVCEPVCGKGEQPAGNGTCQACPTGTFNDQTHSKCVPWSTRCPHAEQKIVTQGTAVSDIICGFVPDSGNLWMMMAILLTSFAFLITVIASLAYTLVRWTKKKRSMITTITETTPEKPSTVLLEGRPLVQQESSCSSCSFPEQEHGSSLESVASLDSKVKLLTV